MLPRHTAAVIAAALLVTSSGCAISDGWLARKAGAHCRVEKPIVWILAAGDLVTGAAAAYGATQSHTTGLQVMHAGFTVGFTADAVLGTLLTARHCQR